MNKTFNVLKWLWLIAAIGSLIAGIIKVIALGLNQDSGIYFVITFISILMFLVNRNRLKNQRKTN